MNNAKLGLHLARKLFEIGDEPNDKVQRIAFKGGAYPHNETDLGGMSEISLCSAFIRILNEARPENGTSPL